MECKATELVAISEIKKRLGDLSNDKWLVQEIERHLEDDPDIFDLALVMGELARLHHPSLSIFPADWFIRRYPGLFPERDWFHSLPEEIVVHIGSMTHAAGQILYEDLQGVIVAPGNLAVMDVLHHRDDLAGVCPLLSSRGQTRFRGLLEAIDEQGKWFVENTSLPFVKGDERLFRASCCNPEGWWVWPAL